MTRRFYLRATASVASAFVLSFAAIALTDPLPRVIWNASASAPSAFTAYGPTAIRPLARLSPSRRPSGSAAGWQSAAISAATCRC